MRPAENVAAGTRVSVVVDGELPVVSARPPGVRYATRPAEDALAGWTNLLGPAWLAVAVGSDGIHPLSQSAVPGSVAS